MRIKVNRDTMLEALSTFVRVTGTAPIMSDGQWDVETEMAAGKLGIYLTKPSRYVEEFGGLNSALRLAAGYNKKSEPAAMLLKLRLVHLNTGNYPLAVLREGKFEWNDETLGICEATGLVLDPPQAYGDVFGSIIEAVQLAEAQRRTGDH